MSRRINMIGRKGERTCGFMEVCGEQLSRNENRDKADFVRTSTNVKRKLQTQILEFNHNHKTISPLRVDSPGYKTFLRGVA